MAIDGVRPQVEHESQIRPTLQQPEVVDALRHGNIYDVLRTPGIHRRDIEDYLSGQWRVFQNQIVQEYQVYATEGTARPPDLQNDFAIHSKEMFLGGDDRKFFHQEMAGAKGMEVGEGAKGVESGDGRDVAGIGEKAVKDWQEFYNELESKVIDTQMFQEMKSKSDNLDKETQRIIALVMSGQIDPEYVLIAAAKSSMLQNGTLFSWKGKKIMKLNAEMDRSSKDILQKNPNDKGYMADLEASRSKARSGQTQMQLDMMDITKFSQNIATTLDWVNNAIRMMAQGRQTPTQAIAAR
ncbi:MAG: hypothetical protein Q7T03_01450 [Deltaproteobacteria bacterium]|nr:hypothetical protein [Deltaproteobacteria bacterium]